MAQKHSIDSKEYPMTREGRIQGPSRRYRRLRHPSFAAGTWAAKNPLLQRGEIGYEIDTHKVKIGDGVTYWNDLAYIDAAGGTWGEITGDMADQTDLKDALDGLQDNIDDKVNIDGTSIMTGPLKIRAGSMHGAVAAYWDGVGLFNLNDNDSVTLLASMEQSAGFTPATTNTYNIGSTLHKWKDLYLGGKAYVATLNNGADITIPATSGTMALTGDLNSYVLKTGDNMSGALRMVGAPIRFALSESGDGIQMRPTVAGLTFSTITALTDLVTLSSSAFYPALVGGQTIPLGSATNKWDGVFTTKLNNGYDIAVPVTAQADTLALKSEVDLAANSGRMITDQGVWYAKMDALGTIPSSAEVEGRNYADFTQVDGGGDPIIVIYTYTSGAWVQTETITPPAAYDGYVPITSKIWDIPEQTGQQGGRILWNHTSKDFTPYPMIVSFDGANITNGAFSGGAITSSTFDGSATLSGTSTVTMPVSPGSTQIVNKDYVDTAIAGVQSSVPLSVDVTFDTSDVNAPTITSDGRIIPNITASHEIIPGMLALDQCEIVLAFEGQHAGAVILWAPSGSNTNSFELTLSSGNLLKLSGVVGVTTIDPAQKYYAKITRVGTTCTLSLSTDGTVFTTECTTTISSLLTTKYCIQTTVGATLYCAECYIVNNGIKIWQGVGSPGLHQRVEIGHEVIRFQAPTALNDYTWYRKYADGWVDQGGVITVNRQNANTSQTTTVDLPVKMADTNYYVAPLTFITDGGNTTGLRNQANDRTTTQLKIKTYSTTGISNNYTGAWEVKGMAA